MKAVDTIRDELDDAERMYDKIAYDPRRNLEKPNEALHYWDGKRTGLNFALQILEKGR